MAGLESFSSDIKLNLLHYMQWHNILLGRMNMFMGKGRREPIYFIPQIIEVCLTKKPASHTGIITVATDVATQPIVRTVNKP